jgi:hypothetical protein
MGVFHGTLISVAAAAAKQCRELSYNLMFILAEFDNAAFC